MMALTEVYCLVNRARGMEVMLTHKTAEGFYRSYLSVHAPVCSVYSIYVLSVHSRYTLHVFGGLSVSFFFLFPQLLSPEDLVNACKMFESLKLPLR